MPMSADRPKAMITHWTVMTALSPAKCLMASDDQPADDHADDRR